MEILILDPNKAKSLLEPTQIKPFISTISAILVHTLPRPTGIRTSSKSAPYYSIEATHDTCKYPRTH